MRALAQRLRDEGGVRETHLRLAFPPIVSPCFEGIDFPTVDELLVRKYCDGNLDQNGVLPQSVLDAMAADLGVTSIKFLPAKELPRAVGKKREDLCIACATKEYPTRKERELVVLAEKKACAGKCGGCGS
jgi:amidophosphoribosyltransferase